MDIATFKDGIIDIYKKYPSTTRVVSIHPMFGPGAESIKGQKILVMKIPEKDGVEEVASFWKELGANVYFADIEKHDYYVAYTIALSYAIGLALARIYQNLGKDIFLYGGTSFRYLLTYTSSLLIDPNAQHYADKAPIDEFIKTLRQKDFPKSIISPEEAYRNFYKALKCINIQIKYLVFYFLVYF